jgi:tetratricopeptide (TPR) repeat protein
MFYKMRWSIFMGYFFVANLCLAQLTLPPSGNNQHTEITQHMGIVSVTVNYNSPNVHDDKGEDRRGKIWGKLVPYGYNNLYFGMSSEDNPSPWRAGANENTTIEFSHDVVIEGRKVDAGKYGVFMVPEKEGEWQLLLSNNSTSWGSYFFNNEDVVYTINVLPESSEYNEYLTYNFYNRELDNCLLKLEWEDLAVPMKIEVENIHELYVDNIRNELKNYAGFKYDAWAEAAMFCAEHKLNLEEALDWANHSIEGKWVGQKNYITLLAKSKVLMAMEKDEEASATLKEAVFHPTAVIFDVHGLGRKFIAMGKTDLAFDVFTWNAKAHPNQWPVNVGLMRGYSAKGDYKNALKYCKKAQKNVDPEDEINVENLKKCSQLLSEGKDIN